MLRRPSRADLTGTAAAVALSAGAGWLVVYVSEPHYPHESRAAVSAVPRPAPAPAATVATTAAATTRTATAAARPATATARPATATAPTATTTRPTATTPTAPAAAPARVQRVAVVVDASARPTYLCVDNGHGLQLFNGVLSGRKTFVRARLRMNIGLSSTIVKVNGKDVALRESPAGLDITHHRGVVPLPAQQRPCG